MNGLRETTEQTMTPTQKRVDNIAHRFVAATVARYGVASALSRARMIVHEYPPNRVPQWLTRSLEILIEGQEEHTS